MKTTKNFKMFFFLGVLIYSLSFVATKRNLDLDPCQMALENWFNKDTTLSRNAFISSVYQDTFIIKVDTTTQAIINWNNVTDSMCNIIKNNCGTNNKPILVINSRDTTTSLWDTRFGKKIYFKQCP